MINMIMLLSLVSSFIIVVVCVDGCHDFVNVADFEPVGEEDYIVWLRACGSFVGRTRTVIDGVTAMITAELWLRYSRHKLCRILYIQDE